MAKTMCVIVASEPKSEKFTIKNIKSNLNIYINLLIKIFWD